MVARSSTPPYAYPHPVPVWYRCMYGCDQWYRVMRKMPHYEIWRKCRTCGCNRRFRKVVTVPRSYRT